METACTSRIMQAAVTTQAINVQAEKQHCQTWKTMQLRSRTCEAAPEDICDFWETETNWIVSLLIHQPNQKLACVETTCTPRIIQAVATTQAKNLQAETTLPKLDKYATLLKKLRNRARRHLRLL